MDEPDDKRCPECGLSTAASLPPTVDSPFHWRVAVPAIIALCMIAAVAYWLYATRLTYTSSSGSQNLWMLDPPFTLAEIRDVAEGKPAKDSLARALAEHVERLHRKFRPECEEAIDVGFFPPEGERRVRWEFGWPRPWYTRLEKVRYDNAVARTGFQPMKTSTGFPVSEANAFYPGSTAVPPRRLWSWVPGLQVLAYRPSVESTGGKEIWHDINILAIGGCIGMILLTWLTISAAVWIGNVLFNRRVRWRARMFKNMVVSVMFALLIVQVIRSSESSDELTRFERGNQQKTIGGAIYWTKDSVSRTTLRTSHLAELLTHADADQLVAKAILAADSISKMNSSDYLGVQLTPEIITTPGAGAMYGQFAGLIVLREGQMVRRPDLGGPEFLTEPKGLSMETGSGFVQLKISPGDPTLPIKRVSMNVQVLGTIALVVYLTWFAAFVICRFIVLRLVIARRRSRGRCIACGYIVNPPLPIA